MSAHYERAIRDLKARLKPGAPSGERARCRAVPMEVPRGEPGGYAPAAGEGLRGERPPVPVERLGQKPGGQPPAPGEVVHGKEAPVPGEGQDAGSRGRAPTPGDGSSERSPAGDGTPQRSPAGDGTPQRSPAGDGTPQRSPLALPAQPGSAPLPENRRGARVPAPRRCPGQRNEEASRGSRRRRTVTVDSSKAKTSLEALRTSIKELCWKEFPFGRRQPCDIYWHGVSFYDSDNICSGQVNKFPGMIEMVRKITLSRAVRTMQELFPEEYNFYPRSWILPEEYHLFVAQVSMVKERDPLWKPTFIVKPDGGSQGDGIYLIKDPADIRMMGSIQSRPSVVQEYISKPLLIDKLKFDIRLYVLLKSLEPLEIYIAKDGLSRFCTEPYQEPNHKNLHHVFMHLTNYSLNVHSGNFIHSDNVHTGSKRTLSSILFRLSSKGVDIKKVWSDIISLVIKTVIALIPELKVYYQSDIPPGKPGPTCFQILGFDVLLMKNLKPVLLEVNANPSMRIEHEQELAPGVFESVPSLVDEEVKTAVIRDTLRLVDPLKRRIHHNQLIPPEKPLDAKKEMQPVGSPEKSDQDAAVNLESSLPSLCLKQVFPKYAKQFTYLRVVERVASIFIRFLGIKGMKKMGPTGFRMFIRNCKLTNSNFSMASVDILYIDITRRWNSLVLDQRESGMCLQAFVEAFLYLAQRKFKTLPVHEQVESLIDLCECHLESLDEKRLLCTRAVADRRAPLAGCHPDGLHVVPSSHVPLLNRTSTANKLADYRTQHS